MAPPSLTKTGRSTLTSYSEWVRASNTPWRLTMGWFPLIMDGFDDIMKHLSLMYLELDNTPEDNIPAWLILHVFITPAVTIL